MIMSVLGTLKTCWEVGYQSIRHPTETHVIERHIGTVYTFQRRQDYFFRGKEFPQDRYAIILGFRP